MHTKLSLRTKPPLIPPLVNEDQMKKIRRHLSFTDDLWSKIRVLAKSENRSISGQIVHMLMQAIGKGKK